MLNSGPVIGKTFVRLLRSVADSKSHLDHKLGYSQKMEDLARMMEGFGVIGFVHHSEVGGLYVAFSRDGKSEQYTKDVSVQDLDDMALEIIHWCRLKGLFL